jgi:endoglucanase
MLAQAPGTDPLNGAQFFVDGPRHGPAAEAIAKLLGVDPTRYPDDYSWARFRSDLEQGPLHSRLMAASGRVRWKVAMLEKIASQPEAMRFSAYSGGGGPGKVFGQVQKLFCHNLTADPGTIPIFTTYFLHPDIKCGTAGQIAAEAPTFKRQVNEVAEGTGNRPAVFLLELDAIGSSHCFANDHDLRQYLALLRYEAEKLGSLPHTVVYEEAGYSDANTVSYTAKALNEAGVRHIRGFFTNDTHENWTIDEVRWAQAIARRTGGAHFIVNTAQNGHGPLKNPHPAIQGNEDLCNPPGRGLGPTDTTQTGFSFVDAFLWTYVPGNSSGCGGGPPAGVFWPARAVALASRANGKLGPGYPSRPY